MGEAGEGEESAGAGGDLHYCVAKRRIRCRYILICRLHLSQQYEHG